MARKPRVDAGCMCYHVINRGNNRSEVFHKDQDYLRFTEMIGEATERLPMRVLSWCLMPNHFHMVLRPRKKGKSSLTPFPLERLSKIHGMAARKKK
jgi:putative transposase